MSEFVTPLDLSGGAASAPAAGAVRLARRTFAGADLLALRSAQGIERTAMPQLARTPYAAVVGTGANSFFVHGMASGQFTSQGTLTARIPGTANMVARTKRTGIVSAATTGALASFYQTTAMVALGNGTGLGGFLFVGRFSISDAASVSGARMFVGLSATVAAPTNVEPSALGNQIGVAQVSGLTTLQIVYGGTAAQTAIDLGANFPASGPSTDLYELILFSDANDSTKMGYRVERLNTGAVAEGTLANTTPGTTLPAGTLMMAMRHWRTNNATALAVGLDIAAASVTWDF